MSEQEHHDEHEQKKHSSAGGHGAGHGGGSHEEHEGAPEWLISFADNVTLMMGFFVILLAFNMKPAGGSSGHGTPGSENSADMLDAAIAIRDAFNNPVNVGSTNPTDLPLIRRILERGGKGYSHDRGSKGKEREVQSLRPSGYHGLCGVVQFDDGSAKLTTASHDAAVEIGTRLHGLRFIIEIRGHVSAAEACHQPDRGMSLSYQRATAVAAALKEKGIPWGQMRLIASADNDRVNAVAFNSAGHHPNERAEVIATEDVIPDYLRADEASAPPAAAAAPH